MDNFYSFLRILVLLITINSSLQQTTPADNNKKKYIKQEKELYECYGPGIENLGFGKMPWDSIKGPVNPNCPMETVKEEMKKKGIHNIEETNNSEKSITYYGKIPKNPLIAEACFGPRLPAPPGYQPPWETLPRGIVYDPGCPILAVRNQETKNRIRENIIESNEEKLKKTRTSK